VPVGRKKPSSSLSSEVVVERSEEEMEEEVVVVVGESEIVELRSGAVVRKEWPWGSDGTVLELEWLEYGMGMGKLTWFCGGAARAFRFGLDVHFAEGLGLGRHDPVIDRGTLHIF